jgi:hypothetical protein
MSCEMYAMRYEVMVCKILLTCSEYVLAPLPDVEYPDSVVAKWGI